MSEATPALAQDTSNPSGERGRIALITLQVVAVIHAIAVFLQPFLAGRFMSGDVSMVGVHSAVGMSVAALGLLQLLACVVWTLRIGRSWGFVGHCALLFLAEVLQIVLGFTRILGLHVPLGVFLVVGTVMWLVDLFRPVAAGAER